MTGKEIDREVLAAVFASKVALAKKSETQAADDAKAEWWRVRRWVESDSTKERSFLWYCTEFELEPSAVRRAIKKTKVDVGQQR